MNHGIHIAAGVFLLLSSLGAFILAVMEQFLLALAFLVCAGFFLLVYLLSDRPPDGK